MTLTDRDLDIIETLTCRVPLLTFAQAVGLWWPHGAGSHTARRRLDQLVGWIRSYVIPVAPLPPVTTPLFTWEPGEDYPDTPVLASQLQRRRRVASQPTEVLAASALAAGMMGSTGHGLPAPERRDHDLHLAAVYVHYRTETPDLAKRWLSEHARSKSGYRQTTADAALLGTDGNPIRLIHVAGRWGPGQLDRFHDSCQQFDLPYELW